MYLNLFCLNIYFWYFSCMSVEAADWIMFEWLMIWGVFNHLFFSHNPDSQGAALCSDSPRSWSRRRFGFNGGVALGCFVSDRSLLDFFFIVTEQPKCSQIRKKKVDTWVVLPAVNVDNLQEEAITEDLRDKKTNDSCIMQSSRFHWNHLVSFQLESKLQVLNSDERTRRPRSGKWTIKKRVAN